MSGNELLIPNPARETFIRSRDIPLQGSGHELAFDPIQLGFSFFVGFALGYMLKIVSKIVMFFAGFFIIGMFFLQYNHLVVYDWSGINTQFDTFMNSFQATGHPFLDFISHNLSNAAGFFGGLVIGFRR